MERGDAIMSKTIKTSQAVEQRREEARKNLERKIQEISASQNLDKTIVRETLEKETAGKRFHVELIRLGESGEIYRCEQRGLQTVLQINTDHNFFRLVYSKIPIEGIEVRAGIELLLFTLATRELDVEGAKKAFYTNERLEWSRILSTLIDVQHSVIEDGALRNVIGRSSEPDEMD